MEKIYKRLEEIFAKTDYALLLKTCKTLLENYPKDIKVLTYYSRALLILSDLDEAQTICSKILSLDSNSAEAHLNLARIFSKKKANHTSIYRLEN